MNPLGHKTVHPHAPELDPVRRAMGCQGITLVEHYAGEAMKGILASLFPPRLGGDLPQNEVLTNRVVGASVDCAVALVEELAKRKL